MQLQDPKHVIDQWLDRYERAAGADGAQMQALREEVGRMKPRQLEKFAAWLQERGKLSDAESERAGKGLRGFGLQPAAGRAKRRINLPGLRFTRAGL